MVTPPLNVDMVTWPVTITVPEAGKCYRLGREASYAAAARGELPGAVRIGRRWVVITAQLRRALEVEDGNGNDE